MTTLPFADLGEAATRRILRGWCGPLVPEPLTPAHDHRKHRLMYMDCTSPQTLEGHVLTFTHSQWSGGTELVFEDGTPRCEGIDVAVGRRVLSWETCWQWIEHAGLDCEHPEVAARLARLCVQAASPAGVWSYREACRLWALLRDDWTPELASVLAGLALALAPKIAALP